MAQIKGVEHRELGRIMPWFDRFMVLDRSSHATRRAIANFNTVDRIGLAIRCGHPQETFRKQMQSCFLTLCVCAAIQHFQH
jgi:hypothetical protein